MNFCALRQGKKLILQFLDACGPIGRSKISSRDRRNQGQWVAIGNDGVKIINSLFQEEHFQCSGLIGAGDISQRELVGEMTGDSPSSLIDNNYIRLLPRIFSIFVAEPNREGFYEAKYSCGTYNSYVSATATVNSPPITVSSLGRPKRLPMHSKYASNFEEEAVN